MATENIACFTWCVRFRKAFNERWARFRNRFRNRYYRRRGGSVDQSTVLNETGTKDMVVSKKLRNSNKVVPDKLIPSTNLNDRTVLLECIPAADGNQDLDQLIEEYVSDIINAAANALRLERWHLPSNTNVTNVMSTDDNISLSSSIISQIASTAVADSLTKIALNSDRNQSAKHGARPRTVNEFLETYGIAGDEVTDDSLPQVSE